MTQTEIHYRRICSLAEYVEKEKKEIENLEVAPWQVDDIDRVVHGLDNVFYELRILSDLFPDSRKIERE